MKKIFQLLLFVLSLNVSISSYAAGAMLRITCSDTDVGAIVFLNGKFKGECPFDMVVPEDSYKLRVVKAVDALHEKIYEQTFRIADDTIKKIEVKLNPTQFNAEGQRNEAERIRQQAEAAKRILDKQTEEAKRIVEAKTAAARTRKNNFDAVLAGFSAQGIEPNNGKAVRDCPDCPEIVLVQSKDQEVFGVGKFEVTVGEFRAFIKETNYVVTPGCTIWVGGWLTNTNELWQFKKDVSWINPGFVQTDRHPVVCISEINALAYLRWLSSKTGQRYVLPSTTQWLVANQNERRKDNTPWILQVNKNHPSCLFGNFYDRTGNRELSAGLGEEYDCIDGFAYTAPVGSFQSNSFGIFDLWGNVREMLSTHVKYTKGLSELLQAPGMAWSSGAYSSLGYDIAIGSQTQEMGFRVVRLILDE